MSEHDDTVRALLAYLGAAMVATGQPVGDVEDELAEVSLALGYPDVQIAASPTGVFIALTSGAPVTFEAVAGGLRLDQAAEVRLIRHRLVRSVLTAAEATEELRALRDRPPRYPQWMANLGWIAIATGIALILQPGGANVVFAAAGAVVVVALFRLGQRFGLIATLLPTLAAFLLACGVFAAANADLLEGPLRTLLPPLAVLLPGALIVTAMFELAAGDMVAGASRLIFGLVQLLLFTLGIVAASHLIAVPAAELTNLRVDTLGWWAAPLGLILISLGIGALESPPLRLLPWIMLVLVLAFAAQSFGQHVGGAALGSFLGAVAATLGSSLVEAVRPDLPRLVVFMPAFWLLVPGSLGLLSTTTLITHPAGEAANAFDVVTVVCAIAVGLLVGAAVARSFGGAVGRLRRREPRGRRGRLGRSLLR
ncbi:threonine/serine ThrE exporter family protein [Mycolicibacterium canariasense]|uniref:threonine/serine ThrE exporter family protein n=1 Tax=Mycolicibacterium canariasense TaxID=228230 RepID=UPI001F29FF4F|nr:threonine/serine exporter family protein [Mycolicibacterium canariasense]